jgi:hypothetical protein
MKVELKRKGCIYMFYHGKKKVLPRIDNSLHFMILNNEGFANK